ncbi:hypothetical protein BKG76_00065 [Mycobacteroides franklinii]|uniref:PQQ-binding-like beta-propeller repeat protein n=2 Tax=Mycobacteroides franklinii TaxID=948102 RepID=A0A1S1LFE5_9MYCO|nr:hypothetical protein BKG76_00065 [Mycobacteroides franklinii]
MGLASGAVVLGAYGFVRRNPVGLHEVSVRNWAAVSVLLVAFFAAALIWTARSAMRGVDVVGRSALLLTVIVAAALYAVLADPAGLASSTHTALVLMRLSWVFLVIAAVFVVAGAVASVGRATLLAQSGRGPKVVVGLALGLIFALGTGALAQARNDVVGVIAAPIEIPVTPTRVGTEVRYALPLSDPGFVVPAGPGFVTLEDQDLVGYAGNTGQQRWRLPFKTIAYECEPSSVRSTGTSADSVVIVQCLRPTQTNSYSDSARRTILTGVDAMTGRVLWANADNWRIRSTAVTGPDVVPVLRGDEVGALEVRTGNVLWTKQFTAGDCGGNLVGLGNKTQDIVFFPICPTAHEVVLRVVDAHSGAERSLTIEREKFPDGVSQVNLLAAAAGVVVIEVAGSGPNRSPYPVNLAVDIDDGASMALPSKVNVRRDRQSHDAGQYPGPVLQIDTYSDDTAVLLVGERRIVKTSIPTTGTPIMDGQRWALVGDQLVTATAATASWRAQLATVGPDGKANLRPSPCGGADFGGVIPVPGAVLVTCARTDDSSRVTGYAVIGLV